MYLHAERLLAKAGVARRNGEGYLPPLKRRRSWSGKGEAQRGLHKRQRGRLGTPLRRAIGAGPLSVLSTSVTKQTGDMVYSEARRLRILGIWARTTMLYALERESDLGSTYGVFVELSERGDVSSGPVP
jgi:hypothetical protein